MASTCASAALFASPASLISTSCSHASHHSKLNFGKYSGLRATQLPRLVTMNMKKITKRSDKAMVSRRSHPIQIFCQSTLEMIQDIIATQLSVDRENVKPETKFSELGADSLDTVEIVMSLEERFGVSIGEQDAENISTVQQVADLIEKQKVA